MVLREDGRISIFMNYDYDYDDDDDDDDDDDHDGDDGENASGDHDEDDDESDDGDNDNDVVEVTIQSNGARTLKGFFLQGDATEASFAGELTCTGFGHQVNFCGRSGVTHSDATPKVKVQCRWTPPDFQLGSVQFTATIVENFSTFWTGVKSEVNLSPDPTSMTYEQKSLQLREDMLRKFRQGASGLANRFQSQLGSNALSGLFGQSQKQGQSNLPGIVNNLSSWFGGQGQAQTNNANSNSNTNPANSNNNRHHQANAFSLGRNTGLSQFQQFFGAQ
ncbi:hypothetical protein ElyMa_005895200 [Elysia marginata]|uniref:Reelin domain-containing protein n=1 Tax=Elysia marginata TaxID=1093978 RepID=A0AAV4G3H9_9GAST|nr:hypothetical protein ElyMa_005895200 [Elysia marginata]